MHKHALKNPEILYMYFIKFLKELFIDLVTSNASFENTNFNPTLMFPKKIWLICAINTEKHPNSSMVEHFLQQKISGIESQFEFTSQIYNKIIFSLYLSIPLFSLSGISSWVEEIPGMSRDELAVGRILVY